MNIDVLILTKNEEEMISACIDSVEWATRVILIDSYSSDQTVNIAKKKGAEVFFHPFSDYSQQRNYALSLSTSDWVLYLDADERISNALRDEIKSVIPGTSTLDSYRFLRNNYFFGQLWPFKDQLPRLFKRKSFKKWYGKLHETPTFEGRIGSLTQLLDHYSHRGLESMMDKTIVWSEVEARLRLDVGHPPVTWWRLIRVAATGFIHSYVYQKGFLVGTRGLLESIYQGYSMFITYARLWEMQKKTK